MIITMFKTDEHYTEYIFLMKERFFKKVTKSYMII